MPTDDDRYKDGYDKRYQKGFSDGQNDVDEGVPKELFTEFAEQLVNFNRSPMVLVNLMNQMLKEVNSNIIVEQKHFGREFPPK